MRGTNISGMCGTWVRERPWLLHRFQLEATLAPGCARASVVEGLCVTGRGLCPHAHKEVHVAAVVIVPIKQYFPEFLLWHLGTLPRMPFPKLLFDF